MMSCALFHNVICIAKWYSSCGMGQNLHYYKPGCILKCQNTYNIGKTTNNVSCVPKQDGRSEISPQCDLSYQMAFKLWNGSEPPLLWSLKSQNTSMYTGSVPSVQKRRWVVDSATMPFVPSNGIQAM